MPLQFFILIDLTRCPMSIMLVSCMSHCFATLQYLINFGKYLRLKGQLTSCSWVLRSNPFIQGLILATSSPMRVVSLLSCVCMWFLVVRRCRWYQNKIKDIMAYFQFPNIPGKGKWFSPTKSIIKTCQHGFFPHGPFPRVVLSLAESKI